MGGRRAADRATQRCCGVSLDHAPCVDPPAMCRATSAMKSNAPEPGQTTSTVTSLSGMNGISQIMRNRSCSFSALTTPKPPPLAKLPNASNRSLYRSYHCFEPSVSIWIMSGGTGSLGRATTRNCTADLLLRGDVIVSIDAGRSGRPSVRALVAARSTSVAGVEDLRVKTERDVLAVGL